MVVRSISTPGLSRHGPTDHDLDLPQMPDVFLRGPRSIQGSCPAQCTVEAAQSAETFKLRCCDSFNITPFYPGDHKLCLGMARKGRSSRSLPLVFICLKVVVMRHILQVTRD